MYFPLVSTLINGAFVFGPIIVLYEIGGIAARWASAAISWVLFLVNVYVFFWVSIPKMQSELGTRKGVYRFFGIYFSITMAVAALGYSIWVLDTSVGKAAQFQALGDETVSGYVAFLRIWISSVSIVWGHGDIPNLPVGVLALLWNLVVLINSVVFLILVSVWAQYIYKGFYRPNTPRRRRKKKKTRHKRDMEIPSTTMGRQDEDVIQFVSKSRRNAKSDEVIFY